MLERVKGILEEGGFEFCEYNGCFDIAARKEAVFLIKLLTNIDSLQEDQASSLKTISSFIGAKALLVGLHTRREQLSDGILYERFGIPAITPKTLENILLDNANPSLYRFRGGMFAEINPTELRSAREQKGLSQAELAAKVGITKKSVYEHENTRIKIEYKNAAKIERVLKAELIEPLEIETTYEKTELAPRTIFETKISRTFRRIGFDTNSVYQSPFNMLASDKELLLLSDVEEKQNHIGKKIPYIKDFSKISRKSAVIITREEANFDVPSLTEDKLSEMKPKDIRKIIKKW